MTTADQPGYAELRVPCSECLKDHGFCVYCSRTFASPNKLHRHIATKHPGIPTRSGGCTAMEPDTAATCGDRNVFPRDRFARVARAEVWCEKPAGHAGSHEATKGGTAFSWRRCATCKTNPPALGSDICVVCHDAL